MASSSREKTLSHDAADEEVPETGPFLGGSRKPAQPQRMSSFCRRLVLILSLIGITIWAVALFVYLAAKQDADAGASAPAKSEGVKDAFLGAPGRFEPSQKSPFWMTSREPVSLSEVVEKYWNPKSRGISWIEGPNGEDGLLLSKGAPSKDYLVVEDVRAVDTNPDSPDAVTSRTLMRSSNFTYNGQSFVTSKLWPSKDQKKVLLATDVEKNWRHSFYAIYWILDVETQSVEPLDPSNTDGRVQLATLSPNSDAVVFTRENNMYLRYLSSQEVVAITTDGGENFFYGIPDWVYEEEVFYANSATWWSEDGQYIAFLQTNETLVNQFPVTFYFDRPSGIKPEPGLEAYPEIQYIKYPKAGSPNPFVDLQIFDMASGQVSAITIEGDFPADDKLITEVTWAGNQILVKESNRVSEVIRVILVDVPSRTGRSVRELDVRQIDGGWFEVSHATRYIPADGGNGRPEPGYIDTVIYENNIHLAYFSPLDANQPIMLTSGDWEVSGGAASVDTKNNLVYFVSTKESPLQRHVYSVYLNGTDLTAFTNTDQEGYYSVSFSRGAGYALLTYSGPGIPWQKVVSTPTNPSAYSRSVEENKDLQAKVGNHSIPTLEYGQIDVDGFKLNYVEHRPPNFDATKKYPVLFFQYAGPGSQLVSKKWSVDFQSYVASSLGYLVVTVDGRGTGYMGRKHRVVVHKQLGKWEPYDQVQAGKHWAGLDYVDPDRLAIWGWSYGGFNTLKTLELDGGETFRYGMAVAPVTSWRFYDTIYTERYMLTPQQNPQGYNETAVTNVTSLGQNVRFLIMHGTGDDNVHLQNTLALLNLLDAGGIFHYDVHVFPDSNHRITYNGAYRIVYESE